MSRSKRSFRYPRWVLLLVALLLPTASLVPLGSFWLWQNGYILYWAVITCIAVMAVFYLERRLIDPAAVEESPAPGLTDPGDPRWTPRQAEAWDDVLHLAERVPPTRMASRDAVLGLGLETIETVAKRLRPERHDPLLQFTVPEALAVIERASINLRRFIVSSFPLGDRVTVAQIMWLYRWRGMLELAEKGYDLWRIVRLLNPVAAATQELRERFTRQVYDLGRDHLARRLARAFVREVGRAAIDPYGGNLRVAPERLQGHVTAASRHDIEAYENRQAEPVRILVAGQVGAGKSSLINALAHSVEAVVDSVPSTKAFSSYRLSHAGLPAALIVDSPGLAHAESTEPLVAAADDCDMLLWVVSAVRAARDLDARGLDAIRAHFAAEPNRHPPPMLLILTHIDAVRPFGEWDPPYDLAIPTRPKSQSIHAAVEAAGAELGFAADSIIPARVDGSVPAYNMDVLWAKILELTPEAQRARLLRTLDDIRGKPDWGSIWSQAINAGRVIGDTFLRRSTNHVTDEQSGGSQDQLSGKARKG